MVGMRTSSGRALIAVLAIGLAAAACGSSETVTAESGQPSGNVLPPSTFEAVATTVEGDPFELSALAGSDVVLWFWAPW